MLPHPPGALTCLTQRGKKSSDAFSALVSAVAKRVELKRDRLSCCDLPLPGTNYRLPGPLGRVCYLLSPQAGLR